MEKVVVDLPADITRSLRDEGINPARRLLESFALEEYRNGRISEGKVAELLGLSFWDTQQFLGKNKAYLHYSAQELREDAAGHSEK